MLGVPRPLCFVGTHASVTLALATRFHYVALYQAVSCVWFIGDCEKHLASLHLQKSQAQETRFLLLNIDGVADGPFAALSRVSHVVN